MLDEMKRLKGSSKSKPATGSDISITTEPKPYTWSIEEIRAAATQSAKLTPLPHGYFSDMTMGVPYQWTAQMDDRVRTHVPKPEERARLSDDEVMDLIRKAVGSPDYAPARKDGHSTGPILTGEARTSYLAIQSGAEDPHALPEPLTEPSCDYCNDTGVGHLGMDCPVRGCEAVTS